MAASNVIFEFPLQLPSLVPDQGEEAPAAVMSRKSTSVFVAYVPTVRVLGVVEIPLKRIRLTGDAPAATNVVIVWSA